MSDETRTLTRLLNDAYDGREGALGHSRALERLEGIDARSAEAAESRLVSGSKVAECVPIVDVAVRTIEREWGFARRRLAGEVRRSA